MSYKNRLSDVPMPPRIASLTRDRRGYPIPFIALRDTDGIPHFTINDHMKVMHARMRKVCSICGKGFEVFQDSRGKRNPTPENAGMWFVGGPMSAFHPHGAYIDPPAHRECHEYALRVCPYLAAPSYARRIEGATLDPAKLPRYMVGFVDSAMIPERPEVFVSVWCEDHIAVGPGGMYMKPAGVRAYQFWRHGERVPAQEAAQLQLHYEATVGAIRAG